MTDYGESVYRPSGQPPTQPSTSRRGPSGPPPGQTPARPPVRPPDNRVSERVARLTLTCLGASFTVLMIGLVVFFTVRTLRQNADDTGVVGSRTGGTTPEDAARIVGGIGPPHGTDLGAYVNARKQALATATGDRVAVVSLTDYATEARARALAGGLEVLALLAAAPGGAPSVVTGDLASWVSDQTAEARAERDEITKLIPTVKDDPAFQKFYEEEVDRLNALINAIRPSGNLVFGVVVRAPVPALQELSRRPEVRLVDVGPDADPGPKPSYRGVRPEETVKANEPNTRPT